MINGYNETSPGIFQSGEITQEDIPVIQELAAGKPVAIFSMQDDFQDNYALPDGWVLIEYPQADLPDGSLESIADRYLTVGNRIADHIDLGYICWIHCVAGCNRSTMANIAYRVIALGEEAHQAFDNIKMVRRCIRLVPPHELSLEFIK